MLKKFLIVCTTILIYTVVITAPFFFMKNAEAEIIVNNNENNKPGTISMFSGSTIPDGYLLCDGRAVSRTTYSALFAIVGTTAGAGDGSTTFNLPNFQGKVAVGKNAGTFNTLGKTGGEEAHKITASEMPAHTHSISSGVISTKELVGKIYNIVYQEPEFMGTATGVVSSGVGWKEGEMYGGISSAKGRDGFKINATHNHTLSGNTTATGAGASHNNLQPYTTINYVIKY